MIASGYFFTEWYFEAGSVAPVEAGGTDLLTSHPDLTRCPGESEQKHKEKHGKKRTKPIVQIDESEKPRQRNMHIL
jgi:hypothetical protein